MTRTSSLSDRPARVSLGAQVERAIRERIARDHLREGDPLPSEGELAAEFGVAKSTVREAVRRLETMGHIKAVHGVGLRVGSFSIGPVVRALPYDLIDRSRSLREILEVRTVIEENFLVEAARRMGPDDLAALESIIGRMEAQSPAGDVDPDIDAEFHRALYTALGNKLVTDLIGVFWHLFHDARMHMQLTRNIHAVKEHRDIVDALRRGDELDIRAAMRMHFRQIRSELERLDNQEAP